MEKSRKIQIGFSRDMLSANNQLLIRLNNKEIALESENTVFELEEFGLLKLLELAMTDEEYMKYLTESSERISKLTTK